MSQQPERVAGNPSGAEQEPPQPLPGWSSKRLLFRGYLCELACLPLLVVVVLASKLPGPTAYWGIGCVTMTVVLVSIGVTLTLRGYRKGRREMERGYTTTWLIAHQNPELWYLTTDFSAVISGPSEPRPKTGRAADERAAIAARSRST
jgi:hypothetical protein